MRQKPVCGTLATVPTPVRAAACRATADATPVLTAVATMRAGSSMGIER